MLIKRQILGKEKIKDLEKGSLKTDITLGRSVKWLKNFLENAQGMFAYRFGSFTKCFNKKTGKGTLLVQMSTEGFMALVNKLKSLEQSQALEKGKLEVANEQWEVKFGSVNGIMKTLLSHTQEKLVSSFV